MNLPNDMTLKCGAFTSVKCHTVIPSFKLIRSGKPTLWLTPGVWYAYSVSVNKETDHVSISQDTTVVFRFLNFHYTKVIDTMDSRIDTA